MKYTSKINIITKGGEGQVGRERRGGSEGQGNPTHASLDAAFDTGEIHWSEDDITITRSIIFPHWVQEQIGIPGKR